MGRGLGDSFASILGAAQSGGGWAFARLFETYAGKVTGYLRIQGAVDPDDLTSEVFLGAFRSIRSFNGDEAAFRSWLFSIAHRRLIDARRAATRRPRAEPLDEASTPAVPGSDQEVMARLATERVQALCAGLVPDQRDVLLLRLVSGLTVEEVSRAVDKSPGAVKALQRRGLAALRKVLQQEGVTL